MSDANDALEFMSSVGSEVPADGDSAAKRRRRQRAENSLSEGKEDSKKPGVPSQYTVFGPGYLPVSPTIEKLPADCYKIEETQSGLIFVPMNLVTDAILRLPDTKSGYVVSEIKKFWEREERFKKSGTTYKMGVMMYGPPGSGKTMTINIVMEEAMELGGLVIVADRPRLVTDALQTLRKVEPTRPLVVVLEDIDAIIERYGEPEMLSLLDGENQIENVVYLATTNYPERIDARFMNRPSRFDYIVKVDMPTAEARKMYFEFKNIPLVVKAADGSEIDLVAETAGLSIAHIREVFRAIFLMDHDPAATIKRVSSMKVLPKSGSQNAVGIGRI